MRAALVDEDDFAVGVESVLDHERHLERPGAAGAAREIDDWVALGRRRDSGRAHHEDADMAPVGLGPILGHGQVATLNTWREVEFGEARDIRLGTRYGLVGRRTSGAAVRAAPRACGHQAHRHQAHGRNNHAMLRRSRSRSLSHMEFVLLRTAPPDWALMPRCWTVKRRYSGSGQHSHCGDTTRHRVGHASAYASWFSTEESTVAVTPFDVFALLSSLIS